MMVLLIVLLQAAPVLLVAVTTRSLEKTTATTIVMSIIALVMGNPIYIAIDLIGIWATYAFCYNDLVASRSWTGKAPENVKIQMPVTPAPPAPAAPKAQEKAEDGWAVGLLIFAVVIGYHYFKDSNTPASGQEQRAPAGITAAAANQQVHAGQPGSISPDKSGNASKKTKGDDARRCLDLKSDAAIVACAENYR